MRHRDTLIMTITATLAGAIGMLANFAFFFGGRGGDCPEAEALGERLVRLPLFAGMTAEETGRVIR